MGLVQCQGGTEDLFEARGNHMNLDGEPSAAAADSLGASFSRGAVPSG